MTQRKTDENRYEWSQTIRFNEMMEGIGTLAEVVAKLRSAADYLESMEKEGWELEKPIERRPRLPRERVAPYRNTRDFII